MAPFQVRSPASRRPNHSFAEIAAIVNGGLSSNAQPSQLEHAEWDWLWGGYAVYTDTFARASARESEIARRVRAWPVIDPVYAIQYNHYFNGTMGPSGLPVGRMSPTSSPRLPSPPPFPEVQIGPKSPGMNATQGNAMPENEDTTKLDQGAMRRIRPGTKATDFAGPPLVPLGEVSITTPSTTSPRTVNFTPARKPLYSQAHIPSSSTPPSSSRSTSKPSTTTTFVHPTILRRRNQSPARLPQK